MHEPRPQFQFSLRVLFWWVLALSVQCALAALPWPVNGYFAPLYASVLAGYVGSRSPWLAAVLGGFACLAASYLMMAVEANRRPVPLRYDLGIMPWVAGCCCFPGGAYVGLTAGLIAVEYRNKRRFKSRLESLYQEIAIPDAPHPASDQTQPPDPTIQADAAD